MRINKLLSMIVILLLTIVFSCLTACQKNDSSLKPNNQEHTHSFSAWGVSQEPSCTTQGMQTRVCSLCGFSEYSPIPTLEHQYNDGEIIINATCTQNGTKKYTCTNTNCGHSYTESFSLSAYTATELYEQAVKYVGEIVTYDKNGAECALGTGFVISSDGRIITNYHVIEEAYSASITINNTQYDVTSVLAYDANIDLAVLKINASGLTAATICKQSVSVGSTVYAIGSSRGMTNTYSQGIVTYANRFVDGVSHIQHDASITNGNSGGPLINAYGEIIGINTWGISDSQNLNFAVFTTELDNLVYGTPITLSELFQKELSPYESLINWVLDNYTETYFEGRVLSVEHINGDYVYSISYDLENEYLYIDVYDGTIYFSLDLIGTPSEYPYYFDYDYNGISYSIEGIVDANTFTVNSALTSYKYDGPSYGRESAVSLTQTAMCTTLSFFNYYLTANDLDVCIEDFGFLAYKPNNNNNNNTDALTKEWFANQFNVAKSNYLNSLSETKTSKNNQISNLQSQINSYYSAYLNECKQINERCAAMGMTNSGYHKNLLDTAKSNYESAIKGYTNQIANLKDEIANIDKELSNPSVSSILSILADNCGISKQQAQEYYDKYIGNT